MRRNDETYTPMPARIDSVFVENGTVKTFRMSFLDKKDAESFSFTPGQFAMFSLMGYGEAPFSMCSPPSEKGYFEISVRKVGNVTGAMFRLKRGDVIGVRGPFGEGYPLDRYRKKDFLIVAGGIGFPPLGSVLEHLLGNRDDYGKIWVVYGVRDLDDIIFRKRIKHWTEKKDVNIFVTIETPCDNWSGCVGRVTDVLRTMKIDGKNTVGLSCGPPVMLKYVAAGFRDLGIKDPNIYVSLERLMHCGMGKCGHCSIGDRYVCTDGPVFSYADIKDAAEKVW